MKAPWRFRPAKRPLSTAILGSTLNRTRSSPALLSSESYQCSNRRRQHLEPQFFTTSSKEEQPFAPKFSKDNKNLLPLEGSTSRGLDVVDSKRKGKTGRTYPGWQRQYIQSNRSSSKSIDDAFSLVQMKTKALTEAPFGSWKSHHWKEAIQTMYMWSEKEGSFFGRAESVLESFALLERALLEYKRSTSLKQKHAALESLDTELLNSVVDNWRTCWVQLQKPTIRRTSAFNEAEQQARLLLEFTVENMLSKISTYKVRSSGLIDPDRRTFLMIQDAATASQKRSKRSAFALDILARIAQENEQLLDYEMYTKFIKSCAKLGDAEQAESCLEHMYKQFDKTNKKDLKPDTKIFNLVLLAWSQSSADSKYASQRSRGILKRMQDLAESRGKLEGAVVPSYMSYSLVIKCLSNWLSSLSLTHENAEKAKNYEYVGDLAEELLREMDARSAKGVKMVKPNAVVYNSVLHIWSLLGNAERCENLLQIMYDDFSNRGNFRAEPNVASFTTVINAWANRQKILGITSTSVTSSNDNRQTTSEIGNRAEAILRRMQDLHSSGELKNVEPNAFSYSSCLQCWANGRSSEAGERAEAILKEMEIKSKEDCRRLVTSAAYSAVLQAYAGSGNAKKAEAFLGQLTEKYRAGKASAKPKVQYLTILLAAWSRSNDPQAPLRAEALLREMWTLCKEGIIDGQPNVVSYSAVLDCFAKSSLPYAAERAEQLLDGMATLAKQGDAIVRPNTIAYRNVINAYARIGNVEKTEELVEKMFDDYKRQGNTGAKPNLKTLNLVLSALSNSTIPNAAVKAESYLRYMQDLYSRKLIDEKPNVVSYSLLLKCISRSNSKDAGLEAERIINEMEQKAQAQGDRSLLPNTMSWSTAIQAYARTGEPEKAEALLERMYKSYRNGNAEAVPNSRTFTNVLQAWCKQKNGAERALAILDWMKELHSSKSLSDVKPNMITYATVLGGLARERKRSAAEQALTLLREMERQTAAGDIDVKPSGICYNNCINAFANIGDAQRAQELVAQMYHSYNEGTISHKPSIATWNIILVAWSRSSDPQAASKAETVLKRMHELYDTGILNERPNGISYTTCLCCWVVSRSKDRCSRVEALLDRMDALKDSGDKLIYKDMYDYTLTIRVLCRMRDDKLTTRAEFLMRRMLKDFCCSHPKWKTEVSGAFHSVITAYSNSRDPAVAERADRLRKELRTFIPGTK